MSSADDAVEQDPKLAVNGILEGDVKNDFETHIGTLQHDLQNGDVYDSSQVVSLHSEGMDTLEAIGHSKENVGAQSGLNENGLLQETHTPEQMCKTETEEKSTAQISENTIGNDDSSSYESESYTGSSESEEEISNVETSGEAETNKTSIVTVENTSVTGFILPPGNKDNDPVSDNSKHDDVMKTDGEINKEMTEEQSSGAKESVPTAVDVVEYRRQDEEAEAEADKVAKTTDNTHPLETEAEMSLSNASDTQENLGQTEIESDKESMVIEQEHPEYTAKAISNADVNTDRTPSVDQSECAQHDSPENAGMEKERTEFSVKTEQPDSDKQSENSITISIDMEKDQHKEEKEIAVKIEQDIDRQSENSITMSADMEKDQHKEEKEIAVKIEQDIDRQSENSITMSADMEKDQHKEEKEIAVKIEQDIDRQSENSITMSADMEKDQHKEEKEIAVKIEQDIDRQSENAITMSADMEKDQHKEEKEIAVKIEQDIDRQSENSITMSADMEKDQHKEEKEIAVKIEQDIDRQSENSITMSADMEKDQHKEEKEIAVKIEQDIDRQSENSITMSADMEKDQHKEEKEIAVKIEPDSDKQSENSITISANMEKDQYKEEKEIAVKIEQQDTDKQSENSINIHDGALIPSLEKDETGERRTEATRTETSQDVLEPPYDSIDRQQAGEADGTTIKETSQPETREDESKHSEVNNADLSHSTTNKKHELSEVSDKVSKNNHDIAEIISQDRKTEEPQMELSEFSVDTPNHNIDNDQDFEIKRHLAEEIPREETESVERAQRNTRIASEQDVTCGQDNEEHEIITKLDTECEEETNNTPDQSEEILPECELVKRNFNIDECFPILDDVEQTVNTLLGKVKLVTEAYNYRITNTTLRDFVTDLSEYNGDFLSIKEAYRKCEEFTSSLVQRLKELRESTNEVNALIGKKFRSEELAAWLELETSVEQENFTLQEERKAHEKAGLARAAEARATICRASTAVAEAFQLAAEAETEAIEAQNMARETRQCAETAIRAAREAWTASEEKRKAEDEAKQKAIERARIKAEADRLKREEEEMLLAEEATRKGTSLADERKRAEEEKNRLENERKNPKNWPRYIYSVENGNLQGGIGCIVRAVQGSLSQNDVECRCVDQLSGLLSLEDNEELISNIIEIAAVGQNEAIRFEEPISVAMPHCLSRTVPGREPVIKAFGENKNWRDLATSDVFFEDVKDMRFVEGKTSTIGLFAVVLRLKKDKQIFFSSGNKVISNSDSRVTMTCNPGTFRLNINFQLEVQTVDMATISELRLRKESDCNDLIATSPVIRFSIPNRSLQKPLIVSLPLQQNMSKPKRPSTAVHREKLESPGERPTSAKPFSIVSSSRKEDESQDMLHLLEREGHGVWTKVPGVAFTHVKHKDMVIFEIFHPYERFMLLRTKSDVGTAKAEQIATSVENLLLQHPMQVILRQKSTNALDILVTCTPASKLIKTISKLAAEGYSDGPDASKPTMVREGQIMEIRFRGNVECTSEDSILKFVYNTYMKCRTCFQVEEIEKYAQKSFNCYLGFAQIFTRGPIVKPTTEEDKSKFGSQQKPNKQEVVEGDILLSELLITIPKSDPEPPMPLNTAPVVLSSEGPVTTDTLQRVARKLGEEWMKLAHYLGVKPIRIQSILRQNISNDNAHARFDMLLTWAKRVPRSMDKSEMLSKALTSCGRMDLADEIRGQNRIFRQVRVASAKNSSLRRAFGLIAQDNTIVRDWRKMGEGLGLSELDLDNFQTTGSSERERCVLCLQRWRELNEHKANVDWLCRTLNACSFCELANEIKSNG